VRYPVALLVPILDALKLLAEQFGTTVLLTSATQPGFDALSVWSALPVRNLVKRPVELFEQLRRARYELVERSLLLGGGRGVTSDCRVGWVLVPRTGGFQLGRERPPHVSTFPRRRRDRTPAVVGDVFQDAVAPVVDHSVGVENLQQCPARVVKAERGIDLKLAYHRGQLRNRSARWFCGGGPGRCGPRFVVHQACALVRAVTRRTVVPPVPLSR
jgi:hypothetical protein